MPIALRLYLNKFTNYHRSASVTVSVRQCECDGVSQSHHHMKMMTRTYEVSILTKLIIARSTINNVEIETYKKRKRFYYIVFIF